MRTFQKDPLKLIRERQALFLLSFVSFEPSLPAPWVCEGRRSWKRSQSWNGIDCPLPEDGYVDDRCAVGTKSTMETVEPTDRQGGREGGEKEGPEKKMEHFEIHRSQGG